MKKNIILSILLLLIVILTATWFFLFFKPTHFKRDVTDEQGIVTTASVIVTEYKTNEQAANHKYLNKAVELTGEITALNHDQSGNTTLILNSGDPMSNVFVTLKKTANIPINGTTVKIKGICTGFLSDVVIIDAITE